MTIIVLGSHGLTPSINIADGCLRLQIFLPDRNEAWSVRFDNVVVGKPSREDADSNAPLYPRECREAVRCLSPLLPSPPPRPPALPHQVQRTRVRCLLLLHIQMQRSARHTRDSPSYVTPTHECQPPLTPPLLPAEDHVPSHHRDGPRPAAREVR